MSFCYEPVCSYRNRKTSEIQPLPLKNLQLAVTQHSSDVLVKKLKRKIIRMPGERGDAFYYLSPHSSLVFREVLFFLCMSYYCGLSYIIQIIHFNGILNNLWAWYSKELRLGFFLPVSPSLQCSHFFSSFSQSLTYIYTHTAKYIYMHICVCVPTHTHTHTARLHSKSEKVHRCLVISWLLESAPNPVSKRGKYFSTVLWLVVYGVIWVLRELEKCMRG